MSSITNPSHLSKDVDTIKTAERLVHVYILILLLLIYKQLIG